MKLRWRKINNIIHRDLGYFFVGMTIIYGLSGIALNHIDDWNPSYIINNEEIEISADGYDQKIDESEALSILSKLDIDKQKYKSHYYPETEQVKIFVKGGSVRIDMSSGRGKIETMRRRPVFHSVNFLHYNPGNLWKWFADIFSVSLIILAITGMFVLRGKKGIKGRGAVLVSIGIIIPLILLFFYM